MDTLKSLGAQSPVVIFGKRSCPMSYTINTLISGFGANPMIHNLDEHPNGGEMERALQQEFGCDPSVPAVFIGKKFVGGSDEIMSLNLQGKLKPMLIKAKAIWI